MTRPSFLFDNTMGIKYVKKRKKKTTHVGDSVLCFKIIISTVYLIVYNKRSS